MCLIQKISYLILTISIAGTAFAADECKFFQDNSVKATDDSYNVHGIVGGATIKLKIKPTTKTYYAGNNPAAKEKITNNTLLNITGSIENKGEICEIVPHLSNISASASRQECGDSQFYIYGQWETVEKKSINDITGNAQQIVVETRESKTFGASDKSVCQIRFIPGKIQPQDPVKIKHEHN